MSGPVQPEARRDASTSAAVLVLLVLIAVMLLALFSRTAPHPPLEIAPFLGASLAIGTAAWHLLRQDARHGGALAVAFALTALVSFGPHKYVDPAFSRIWPSVITAQVAVIVILVRCTLARRRQ